MKFFPATVGAERKKLFWLIGLVATAIVAYEWSTHSYDTPQAATAPHTPGDQAIPSLPTLPASRKEFPPTPAQRISPAGPARGSAQAVTDFRPTLKPKEGIDVSAIDPTLHLDSLAKLRNLPMEGGARSVFKEGAAPAPPPPPVSIKPGPMIAGNGAGSPNAEPAKPAGPPPAPPPPPIPLKFYGYANQQRGGPKRAFFLDGEDIFVAGENETIRNRYKIIKIGVNSAVVEDTTDKHQQTLPLVEELAG